MIKFTETHEWISVQDGVGTVGITQYAQKELGDIVYVELPKTGKSISAGQEIVVLESTKAAADVYSPVSGDIIDVNTSLTDETNLINQSPEERGWLLKIRLKNPEELDKLMDRNAYDKQHG